MKKNTIVIAVIILCLAIAGLAYAEVKIGTNKTVCTDCVASTLIGGGVFQTSTNVALRCKSSESKYCENAQHGAAIDASSGKQFHTVYNTPTIDSVAAETTGLPVGCNSDSGY